MCMAATTRDNGRPQTDIIQRTSACVQPTCCNGASERTEKNSLGPYAAIFNIDSLHMFSFSFIFVTQINRRRDETYDDKIR
jgi:hypothetical protein